MNPQRGLLDPVEPIGQLQSMTIKALIVGIISLLTSFGFKAFANDAQIEGIATGVCAAVSLISMIIAWVGRLRAKQVVQTGASGVKVGAIAALLIMPFFSCGCASIFGTPTTQPTPMTASDRLYRFKQVYTLALDEFADAMQAGAFSKDQIKTIMSISGEIDTGIKAADAAINIGDETGAVTWLDRLDAILKKYIELKTLTAPTTRPVARHVRADKPFEVPEWKLSQWSWNRFALLKSWQQSGRIYKAAIS